MKLGAALAFGGLVAIGTVAHPLSKYIHCDHNSVLTCADAKRAVVTEVVFVTETIANAFVYVDENGEPYLTSTVEPLTSIPSISVEPTVLPTSAPVQSSQSLPAPSSSEAPSSDVVAVQNVAPTTSSAAPPPPPPSPPPSPPASSSAPEPSPSAQSDQAPESKPNTSSVNSLPLGITYDPYTGTPDKVDCKTADEIAADFNTMKDFGIVRIYGNDCGQIPVAVRSAKLNGQKLMGGIYAPLQVCLQIAETRASQQHLMARVLL